MHRVFSVGVRAPKAGSVENVLALPCLWPCPGRPDERTTLFDAKQRATPIYRDAFQYVQYLQQHCYNI